MKSRNLFLLFTLASGLWGISCNSESDLDVSRNVTSAEVQASTIKDEIIWQADSYLQAVMDSLKNHLSMNNADTINVEASDMIIHAAVTDLNGKSFPKTVIVDFGSDFSGKIGYKLKGKLVVYMNDTLSVIGAYKKITYDGFYVDSNKLIGSKTITYKGFNSKSNPYWVISTQDTLNNSGRQTILNAYQTRESKVLGGDTIQFSTTGYAGGVNSENKKFTMGISAANPLISYFNYPLIVKGLVTVTSEDKTSTLDYGDGTIDDKAVFTYNGKSKTISIR